MKVFKKSLLVIMNDYLDLKKSILELENEMKELTLKDFLINVFLLLEKSNFQLYHLNDFYNLIQNSIKNSKNNGNLELGFINKVEIVDFLLEFKQKKFWKINGWDLLKNIMISQIYELENWELNKWENDNVFSYLECWISWLIDHYWPQEYIINPIVISWILTLWKIYE